MKRFILVQILFLFALASLFAGASTEQSESTGSGSASGGSGEIPVSWMGPVSATELGITSFGESPVLADMVAKKELPPVEQRLPKEPLVIEWLDTKGTYGGTISTAIHETLQWSDLGHVRLSFLFTTDPTCSAVIPDIAKKYELSEDAKELTIYLREGMKWSNGDPMSADDYMFFYNDIMIDEQFDSWTRWMWTFGGEMSTFEKVDDYTFKIKMAIPNRGIISMINHWYTLPQFFVLPMEFSKQFHIKYNPKADELAKELGYANWVEALNGETNKYPNMDTVKVVPTTGPWVLESEEQLKRVYTRNPYYHAVDNEGNQLPYIDNIIINVVSDLEVATLEALQGKSDVAGMWLNTADMQLFKQYEEKGNYRLRNWESVYGGYPGLMFNQTSQDPAKRKVFQNKKFRQAMSLAINREQMNELVFLGLGVPQQATIHYGASFYDTKWAESYAEYDPDKANAMLDEIGLKKGSDGFRTLPDGNTLRIEMNTAELHIDQCELIKDYWEAVGVKVDLKQLGGELIYEMNLANELDVNVQGVDRMLELRANIKGETVFSPGFGAWGVPWYQWYEDPASGEEPPQHIQDYFELYTNWLEAGTDEDYARYGAELFDYYAEELPVIGTVAWPATPIIISNRINNVVENSILSDDLMWFKVAFPAQWYVTE